MKKAKIVAETKSDEIKNTIKRRWKFIEGKERPIAYIGLSLAFVLSLGFLILVYSGFSEKYLLQMKFDSEKSFNSIYMAMNDSPAKALPIMHDAKVFGVGIYSSNGQAFQVLGDVPRTLPLSKLVESRKTGQDSTLGVYILDYDTDTIEYFRLAKFNIILDLQRYTSLNGLGAQISDLPDVIYIYFDGSTYFSNVRRARVLTILACFMLLGTFLMILSIYNNNRKYRIQLQRNQALAKLGAAARTLTHEIKNPLSAMTLQSAVLRRLLPEEYRSDLDVFDHEITRLTNLTNRVSEFLKDPSGNPQDIEIVAFIRDIARLFQTPVPVKTTVQQVTVRFDPDRARSVFENLIKNAFESTDSGDPQVSVEISSRHRSVTIKVMDRGSGLPQEAKEKLFDPFYTTKIHGSGIGLALSRDFVQAQGGRLKLYDRDGGGTIAEVNLPCKPTPQANNQRTTKSSKKTKHSNSKEATNI